MMLQTTVGAPYASLQSAIGAVLESIKIFSVSSTTSKPHAMPGVVKTDTHVATCALLLELAHADHHFSDDERQYLESTVRAQFGLGGSGPAELLDLAEDARGTAVGIGQFTRLIGDSYSTGQKALLADIMWDLVHSDGHFTGMEDYLMRKICHRLRLDPAWV